MAEGGFRSQNRPVMVALLGLTVAPLHPASGTIGGYGSEAWLKSIPWQWSPGSAGAQALR